MPDMNQEIFKLNRICAHLQEKTARLERAYDEGVIATRQDMKEAFEKIERALRLNAEVVKNMRSGAGEEDAVYSTKIPGKREPFFFTKDITIPAGTTARQTASEQTSSTGPFEAAQLMAAARMSVPFGISSGVIQREIRFRSINSALTEPMAAPNPLAGTAPTYAPDTTYNGFMDFLFEYQTGKSARRRMNAPVPSPFLFTEQGRPLYLPCGDLWPASDSISYTIDPVAATRAWLGGVFPGPVADTAQPVTVTICFLGILYSQAPDYRP
jgi:hypothetical protein